MNKAFVTICLGVMTLTGSADILLWQLTSEQVTPYKGTGEHSTHIADYAVLYYGVPDGTGDPQLLDKAYLFAEGSGYTSTGDFAMDEQAVTIPVLPAGSDLSKSFWLELYDTHGADPSQENKVAWTEPISYETLKDYMTGTLTALSPVFHPQVVPEPTSGLLALLGLAGLALRRRRT